MRIVFELGNKVIEIENNADVYPTAEEKSMFLEMLDTALDAVNISGEDLTDHWTTKAYESERE